MELGLNVNLSKGQKILFLTIFIIFFAILVFWLYIYSPGKDKVKKMQKELAKVEADVAQIDQLIGGRDRLDEVYRKLHERHSQLDMLIPRDDKAALRVISSLAGKSDIEVMSFKPSEPVLAPLSAELKQGTSMKMSVSMELVCTYRNFGGYLNTLKENPATNLLMIDRVIMSKGRRQEDDRLAVVMDATLYYVVY